MKILKWIYENIEEILLGVFLSAMVLVSGAQVVARYVFNNSLTWSEEFCRYIYVWMGFITVGYAIKHGSIIKIDIFVKLFSDRVQKILGLLTIVISFIVILILFKASLGVVGTAVKTGQLTTAMQLPIWLVYISAPVGYFIIELRLIEQFIKLICNKTDSMQKGETAE